MVQYIRLTNGNMKMKKLESVFQAVAKQAGCCGNSKQAMWKYVKQQLADNDLEEWERGEIFDAVWDLFGNKGYA